MNEKPFFSSSVLVLEQHEPVPAPQDSSSLLLRADMESAPTGLNVENVGVDPVSTLNVLWFICIYFLSLSKILVKIPATIAMIIEVIAR